MNIFSPRCSKFVFFPLVAGVQWNDLPVCKIIIWLCQWWGYKLKALSWSAEVLAESKWKSCRIPLEVSLRFQLFYFWRTAQSHETLRPLCALNYWTKFPRTACSVIYGSGEYLFLFCVVFRTLIFFSFLLEFLKCNESIKLREIVPGACWYVVNEADTCHTLTIFCFDALPSTEYSPAVDIPSLSEDPVLLINTQKCLADNVTWDRLVDRGSQAQCAVSNETAVDVVSWTSRGHVRSTSSFVFLALSPRVFACSHLQFGWALESRKSP